MFWHVTGTGFTPYIYMVYQVANIKKKCNEALIRFNTFLTQMLKRR